MSEAMTKEEFQVWLDKAQKVIVAALQIAGFPDVKVTPSGSGIDLTVEGKTAHLIVGVRSNVTGFGSPILKIERTDDPI